MELGNIFTCVGETYISVNTKVNKELFSEVDTFESCIQGSGITYYDKTLLFFWYIFEFSF